MMAFYDIMGSMAHVTMLRDRSIISGDDAESILNGLRTILNDLRNDELVVDPDLEDIHTNIEVMLTRIIGPAGGILHTGRSRNDQVATDIRMYLRDAVLDTVTAVNVLIKRLVDIAQNTQRVIMPGFTHMQHAQPVTVAHHMLAYAFKFGRDADRLMDAFDRINICPLGAAALAGTTYPINRKQTADLLGFRKPTENSMDSVSDRDFVIETSFCMSMVSVHLSSMAEELIMWSAPEFNFIEIERKYTTGSSIMPQKRNPDIAELIRGKAGGAIGDLVSLLTMIKGLPLSYNRDLQEDKGPVMRSLDAVLQSLSMMSDILSTIRFNDGRMYDAALAGHLNATDLADYLVGKGIPFREAYDIVSSVVTYCIREKRRLEGLTISEMKGFSELIEKDVFDILPIEECVERRVSLGGTSSQSVDIQIFEALNSLMEREDRIRHESRLIDKCWDALTS
jgi:argininosuccinate lyase